MPVNTPKELFVKMLSDVRQRTEKATKIYEQAAKCKPADAMERLDVELAKEELS